MQMRKNRRLVVVKESVNYTVLALSVSAPDEKALLSDSSSNSSLISSLSNFTLLEKDSNSSSAAPNPQPNPYDLSGNFNPSMAIIVVVLLSAFFFMGFFSLYVRRCTGEDESVRRGGGGNGRRSSAPHGLDKSIIEKFPVFNYSLVKGLKQGKEALECAVCLSEFEDDETLRLLPRCGHAFHPDCIDMWLFSHSTCPLCRTSLVPDSKSQEFGGNSAGQPQQAAEHVVIVVEAVNHVQNRVDDQGRGTNQINTSYAELSGTSPGQARDCNEQRPLINGLRPLEKPKQNFRRSHSTGHSLIGLGGNPEHPSEFYISTDDRYVLDFVPISSPKAGLHRSSSYAAICDAGSESQGFLNSEAFGDDRERLWRHPSSAEPRDNRERLWRHPSSAEPRDDGERLWRYPSSAEPLALQEVRACTHTHSSRGAVVESDLEFAKLSQNSFNPRISTSDRWSIPLHSPVFLRTFSDSRAPYFQQQETTSTSSAFRDSTARDLKAYLQSVKKGFKWLRGRDKNIMALNNGSEDSRRSSKSPEQGGSHS